MTGLPIVTIPWLRAVDWPQLKTLCPDLQETYEDWMADTEAGLAALDLPGYAVEKVVITAEQIRQRYRATGRKVDGKARMQMAVRIATDRQRGGA